VFGASTSPLRRSRRRTRARRRAAPVLATAVLAFGLLAGAPAGAEEPGGPNRVWRAIKRVPGQIGSATKKAARGIGDGLDRRDDPPPAAREPADKPPPRPAGKRAARPEPEQIVEETPAPIAGAAPAEPEPPVAPPTAEPLPSPVAPHERVAARSDLRRGALLGVFAVALAGVGLALARRRQPLPVAEPPAPPPALFADPDPSPSFASTMPLHLPTVPTPPPTRAFERTTVRVPPTSGQRTRGQDTAPGGFDAAALDARTESAVAEALAGQRATPFPGGGRYELLAEIGRGGMGVVYRARDKRLDRIVALKRLPENLQAHPRAVQLLLREARSAAQLNHPNIVTVYDVDHEDGAYFLTMEFLEGQPLSSLLHRRGRMAASEVAWLGRQAAAGLAYAHERRIVHRDVKTANLFLTRDRVVKIMDFGLAKMMEAVRRRSTRIGGTPDYMAPEQTLGVGVDDRADLYSLGVTLYELLTGTVPFEEGDAERHHRETRPPDPRERAHELPDALAGLVLQLLAKKPDERPASAAEVVERLRGIEQATLRGSSAD